MLIPKRPFFLAVIYSFAFGIGISINATSQGASGDWTTYAIAMSMACGVWSLVYICCDSPPYLKRVAS
ncbi:hypothetical protein Bca52824_057231 [Brassica carinata]|uniref:Uncharacterized protein n=2 Tax=Brassica TaxID=3705 RepID=A0A8S9NFS5_BRACR|nr:hypothetical protein F2Q69_00044193 [Brassica cretica]KAG2274676.1 hypothetical protein Bca52824_057231 [Brassica carinata]